MMKNISIIIPTYNEEDTVNECYTRLRKILKEYEEKYSFDIIFIDDGSKDSTLSKLEEIADNDKVVKVISFSRNFGQQSAIIAGIRENNSDAAVIIDCDMQDPPEIIIELIKLWEEGYEIVYARRKKRNGENIFKLLTSKLFYLILNKLSDTRIPRDTGDFRLIDKKVILSINSLKEHNKFLRGLFSWVGFKQKEYEYERQQRYGGNTKYSFKKMLKLAADGIYSFSTKPLEIVTGIGFISILISILVLIYSLIRYFTNDQNLSIGWTSIIVCITFFSGIQLLSLGIISQYIARIYDESKSRPEYIINKKINM
ncbi:MAG: glycosyltransferase family 2 protein [Clostridia bacterium]|nr:glycosyltransferase family 2 protein [Clostridia bacterium]